MPMIICFRWFQSGMHVFDEQAESTFDQCGLVRQDRFFSHYLHAYDGKERIIVIISDALRYECAKELMTKLDMDEKCQGIHRRDGWCIAVCYLYGDGKSAAASRNECR